MRADRWHRLRAWLWTAALGAAVCLAGGAALAQTAIVNAFTGQACAGTRAATNLNCTANDFTVGLNFTQPAATAIANCVAGEYVTIDVIATLQSGSPVRYDAGIFIGENGNAPGLNNAANQCSLGVFPTTPTPFFTDDTDPCGEFQGSSTATLQVNAVRVLCTPQPGSNTLRIPYLVAWDNNNTGPTKNSCTVDNLTANTSSKCRSADASGVTGVAVLGYVVITKATNPGDATQTFTFFASASPAATVSTSSFQLSNGQSRTITVPLSDTGGTRALVISEALEALWEESATIACTAPGGGTASYVATSSANRAITATLSATNFGALCTITNDRQTRIRTRKLSGPAGDTGTFNLSAITPVGTSSVTNTGSGGATAWQRSTPGAGVTATETGGSSTTLTEYVSSVVCTNQSSGQSVTLTTTSLGGSTRTAAFTPPSYTDTECTFTNIRSANLSVSKSNGTDTVVAGATTSYAIVVTNAGPSHANGAVLRDPAVAGLDCTGLSCSASGGAVCPGTLSVPALQGAGITLSTLPASSSLTFSLTCSVNATGS